MSADYDYTRYYLSVNDNSEKFINHIKKHYNALLKNVIPNNKDIKILDIGCGQGYMLMCLQDLGYENIYGIDISKEQIDSCQSKHLPCQLVDSTEVFLEKHKEEYDFIMSFDVLEHIKKDDTISFVKAIHNSLKDGGIFYCRVPNADNIMASGWLYNDFTHDTSFTVFSLDFVLYNGGFKKINVFKEPHSVCEQGAFKGMILKLMRSLYRIPVRFITIAEFGTMGAKLPLTLNIMAIARK